MAHTLTIDDRALGAIRSVCRRVGCTVLPATHWRIGEETVYHGSDWYAVQSGAYVSPEAIWLGIVGWLDELHRPLVERQAVPEPWMT